MDDRLMQIRAGGARWPAVGGLGLAVGLALLALAVVLWLAAPKPAGAAGTVGNGSPGSCNEGALRAALSGGGLVNFNCGPNTVTITLAAPLGIDQSTTVDGGGNIVLSGGSVTQVFTVGVGASLHVMNITLGRGFGETGGAIENSGVLTVTNAAFVENSAELGSAVMNHANARAYISGSQFTRNSALAGTVASGASLALLAGAEPEAPAGGPPTVIEVVGSRFERNEGEAAGGAIVAISSQLTVTDSVFDTNMSSTGSAIYASLSLANIAASEFVSNVATPAVAAAAPEGPPPDPRNYGGAIFFRAPFLADIDDSQFISNTAEYGHGGAIVAALQIDATMPAGVPAELAVTDSTFVANTTEQHFGGAIYADSAIKIHNSEFRANTAGLACLKGGCSPAALAVPAGIPNGVGGAIYASGTAVLTLTASTVHSNTAMAAGGVYGGGETYILDAEFISNTAFLDGGGLAALGVFHMRNSVVAENTAGVGAGLLAMADAGSVVSQSLFYGNSALTTIGGGVANIQHLVLLNSTVSGNTAASDGGGLYNAGALTLTNTSVVSNTANSGEGGNIHAELILAAGSAPQGEPPVYVQNSLIAFGRAGGSPNNCSAAVVDLGYNLESGNDCGLTAGTSLTNTNPLILPLADRGGPTLVHDLREGSPAIDAANNATCPPVDQRGIARPLDGDGEGGAVCDIGAVEYGALFAKLYMPYIAKD